MFKTLNKGTEIVKTKPFSHPNYIAYVKGALIYWKQTDIEFMFCDQDLAL